MRGYLQKVLLVFAGSYAMSDLGWLFTVFYTMSNSPGQMKVFAIQGLLIGLGFIAAGTACASYLAWPVHEGLLKIQSHALDDRELCRITRENRLLPHRLCALMVFMIPLSSLIFHALYRVYDIGPIGTAGLWGQTAVGVLALPTGLYGGMSFVSSPASDLLYREHILRSLPYENRDIRLSTKIFVLFCNICLGVTIWMSMAGCYEGLFRIREEAQANMLAFGKNMAAEIGASLGTGADAQSLKPVVDRANTSGMGKFFLTSAGGEMLYNPARVNPFTGSWEDIDGNVRKMMSSGRPGTLYENVHERMLCFVPVGNGYVIGFTSDMKSRLGRLGQFFFIAGLFSLIAFGVVGICLLSILLIVVFPVRKTAEKLEDLSSGEGDLTARLVVHSSDEMGELAERFNTFVSKLEEIITDVKQAAQKVDVSSQEVFTSTDGLSVSLQEQTKAFENVAGTIEKMAASIRSNASAAEQGLEKTRGMVSMAGSSEASIKSLVEAMDEVSLASKKIGDIISTVNEVAFQTNLLALNAAVEAARAGEHGKGFAVVADEVRALAQRSSTAAKEIRQLIEDTVGKIATGDSVAKSTGVAMQGMISEINAISRTIEEFASASAEQAVGVDSLTRDVTLIDSSTHQNTRTINELAGNARHMLDAAGRLAGDVDRFKVSGDGVGQRTASISGNRGRRHQENRQRRPVQPAGKR